MARLDNFNCTHSAFDLCVNNSYDNHTGSNDSTSIRGPSLPLLLTTDWLSMFIVFRALAVLSNFAFVLAVYADKTSKGGPRLLIGNLAFCGFLFCISIFPMYIAQEWTLPQHFSSPCISVAPSIFFVTAISWADVFLCVNRSVAICFPHYYDSFRGYKTTWSLIVAGWAVSVFAASIIGTETGLTTAYVKKHNPPRNAGEAARLKRLIDRRLVFVKALLVSLIWNVICSLPLLISSSVPAEDIRAHTLLTNLCGITPGILYAVNPSVSTTTVKSTFQLLHI
ncbi:hypothetical protein RvY_15278 [Ramazzottius varieornatus]|uniref:G-protein coupled receptors family 1 profile domain-containing protein n=1 Tax=Ramazzottius varieornatus TaxID=947166 RepID=A0A1D1VZ35_RAMVA|nr:hypothetical protein RvY_15278 [Ramazzottius varieornatus]